MTNKLKIKSVFTEKELEFLPLTYRVMEHKETKKVDELYTENRYSTSRKHFSKKYMVLHSLKPISNFLINEETV